MLGGSVADNTDNIRKVDEREADSCHGNSLIDGLIDEIDRMKEMDKKDSSNIGSHFIPKGECPAGFKVSIAPGNTGKGNR